MPKFFLLQNLLLGRRAVGRRIQGIFEGRGVAPAVALLMIPRLIVGDAIHPAPQVVVRSPRREVRDELGVPDDEILALTVANVRPEKGYDVLLEAARLTGVQGEAVRFVSVGRGELEGSLRAAAEGAGLGGRFQHLGTRTDIVRLMAGADVFVLPSHQEGLPVALMEAMSAGLPVVVTAVGGVPDIVSDGVQGLVVAPGRPDLLAAAVARLAADPSLRARLGEAAQLRSRDFDVARAVETIEAAYIRILKDR